MKFPLPFDTRSILENNNVLSKTSNLGLLFNKYVHSWQNGWQMKEEDSKKFRDSIAKMTFAKDHIANLALRQNAMLLSLQSSGWHVKTFTATTDSRLIIGLGGTSVIETGITLHPLYGFPYLPGSGLKGLARAYAEIGADASKDELLAIFGSEDKAQHSENNRQGKVFFMDGLPITFPKLELDIMNPHYGDYYSEKKDNKGNSIPPADYLDPNPVTFITVAAEQKFSFAVLSRDKGLAEKAKSWLIGGLTELGAGGKTNVGYGYFKELTPEVTPVKNKQPAIEKDNSLTARLKLVKNEQTFADFIKGIKQDEVDLLKDISFKGMESIINLGLVELLMSVEALPEVKKAFAQKMIEIISPNKKWDEKKHEKYKKLQAIAGKA